MRGGRALVTGAGQRLGRAMALWLGERGFEQAEREWARVTAGAARKATKGE